MNEVSKRLIEVGDIVEDTYISQTNAFSKIEYPFIVDLIEKNNIKKVLDIGTGEGYFLHGLAKLTSNVCYHAIDTNKTLIDIANTKYKLDNITYIHALFDKHFSLDTYDLILARFAVEHIHDIPSFITEAYKRLKEGGLLVITEYYIDSLYSENFIWTKFREAEYNVLKKMNSHPRISFALPQLMKNVHLKEITSCLHHISGTTVGIEDFYTLIISYAKVYNQIYSDIMTDKIRDELIGYSIKALNEGTDYEDILLISHTIGKRL